MQQFIENRSVQSLYLITTTEHGYLVGLIMQQVWMNSIILVVSSSMLIDFLTGGLTPNDGHYSYIVLPNNVWILINRTGGVMVSVLASSVVDRGFEPRSGQTKDYTIDICCFSAKHAALRRKSKYWLGRNQNYVLEWSDMSIRGLLFQ